MLLETRTRFKEDCDLGYKPAAWKLARGELETRTRFKEDCDSRDYYGLSASCRHVGNQDSLQRGLRLMGLHSRGLGGDFSWKPGLASKRIATQPLSVRGWEADVSVGNQDSLQRGLRHAIVPAPCPFNRVGNQDSLQRGLRPSRRNERRGER